MKNKLLFCLLFAAVIFAANTSLYAQSCDPNRESPIRCSYYEEGYRDGASDASNNYSNDYKRYRSKFNNTYERNYREGYQAGYSSVGNGNWGGGWGSPRWTNQQRQAYDSGYNMGQNDRRVASQDNRTQTSGNYNSDIGLYFQAGYDDGFAGRSRRYNFNVGGGNNGGGWGGNNSGTATWSGRVDDRANIILRGRNIRAEDVSGTGLQVYNQNMNGSLPNRDVTITAVKRSGRGYATVTQQPSRYNNYTAIVQVVDTKSGSGDYQIDITWGGGNNNGGGWGNNNGNEQYRSGRVIWRGRVDQTANIRIDGGDVYSEDDSGTGLGNVSYDINGYLAHRSGTVNVRKRSGRGSVFVIQQPSWQNNFTAVIQISDTGSGADNYEVEITW